MEIEEESRSGLCFKRKWMQRHLASSIVHHLFVSRLLDWQNRVGCWCRDGRCPILDHILFTCSPGRSIAWHVVQIRWSIHPTPFFSLSSSFFFSLDSWKRPVNGHCPFLCSNRRILSVTHEEIHFLVIRRVFSPITLRFVHLKQKKIKTQTKEYVMILFERRGFSLNFVDCKEFQAFVFQLRIPCQFSPSLSLFYCSMKRMV